jgi:hypothetical protein
MVIPLLLLVLIDSTNANRNQPEQIKYFRFWDAIPTTSPFNPSAHSMIQPTFREEIPLAEIGYYNPIWKVYYYEDGRIWAVERHWQSYLTHVLRYFHHAHGLTIKAYYHFQIQTIWMFDQNNRLRVRKRYNDGTMVLLEYFDENGQPINRIHKPERNETYYYYWGPR